MKRILWFNYPSKYSPLGCARFDVSLFDQDDGMFASFFYALL